MRLKINMDIGQNGEPSPISGAELDEAIESAVRDMELDGWEVKSATVIRGSEPTTKADEIKRLLLEIRKTAGSPPTAKYHGNFEYTNREMMEYWVDEIQKML